MFWKFGDFIDLDPDWIRIQSRSRSESIKFCGSGSGYNQFRIHITGINKSYDEANFRVSLIPSGMAGFFQRNLSKFFSFFLVSCSPFFISFFVLFFSFFDLNSSLICFYFFPPPEGVWVCVCVCVCAGIFIMVKY